MLEYAKLSSDKKQILYTAFYQSQPLVNTTFYKPVVNDNYPIFDPSIHKIIEDGLVIEEDKVRRTWSILPLESEETRKSWTPLEFWNRFSELERNTIFSLSKDNEPLRLWIALLGIATIIESDHVLTLQAMQQLVDGGLLTDQRRNEILGLI